jgi:hypothetical protein
MRAHHIVTGLAVASLLLAGCTTTGGQASATSTSHPAPPATTSIAPTGSTIATPTTTATVAGSLATLDPCTLISLDELTLLNLTKSGPVPAGSGKGRACGWEANAALVGASNTYSVRIEIEPDLAVGDYPTTGGHTAQVIFQNHKAEQFSTGDGTCRATIIVTPSSTVNVVVTAGEPRDCPFAKEFALLLDTKLPAS